MVRKILLLILLTLLAGIIYGYMVLYPQFPIANGYAAKKMCSCTFIADRSQESIQNEDLGIGPLALTKTKIDRGQQTATTSIFGLRPRTAVFRNDVGCILLQGNDDYNTNLDIERPAMVDTLPWPMGNDTSYDQIPAEVNLTRLEEAIASSFDPGYIVDSIRTRAIVVVYKGHLIMEKYAEGFDKDTEILGWSMTKSITSTLIGNLIKNGKMALDDTGLFEEWQDERAQISLKDLLQMQSGLAFNEDYASISDATRMLFKTEDITEIPRTNRLENSPGANWSYSSGTTNLLCRLIRDQIGENHYLSFPYDSLFNRIGMTSAVMETDESGNYIGSSYCYATPRDWAKLGLLYLNNGNWFGDQVIDTSWVDFIRQPASNSNGIYGGQFWLNVGKSQFKDAPEDLSSCNGFQGQHVFILPSHDLVIVRMGLAEWPDFDANQLIRNVLGSIDFNDLNTSNSSELL